MAPAFASFWGKARPVSTEGPRWHPVVCHLLDVAAVADALLGARPIALRRTAALLGIQPDDARTLVTSLAALHDLGKFAPAFQAKAEEHWPAEILGPFDRELAVSRAHTDDGYALWDEKLADHLADRLWDGALTTLNVLAPAVFGHHGRPVGAGYARDGIHGRFRRGLPAAIECAEAVTTLLCPRPIAAAPPRLSQARIASWWISGLITIADWVGSNQRWFPFTTLADHADALQDYLEHARTRAAVAVREAGLVPSTPATRKSFAELISDAFPPTPVQRWASEAEIPTGPALFVVEDVTGSGKTEAAHILVHRLMAAGRASGAYWAMPTMATANAMYGRQRDAITGLYDPDQSGGKPSLVLAHGQQRLHDAFRRTVLRGDEERSGDSIGDGELDSVVVCAAFLADDRRAALLADVGAGTIDQALLGVLPSRFNTVRLFGLADKVLVIDEAHAYDAYMTVQLHELLRFQAALGGSAIVLSATLSSRQRRQLIEAWEDGVRGGTRAMLRRIGDETEPASRSVSYPLATAVTTSSAPVETPLDTAPWSRRSVSVRLVHDIDSAITHIVEAVESGGAVAWVRNTVDDCLRGATLLRARGYAPIVFHARFAQGDRQKREQEVLSSFGPGAEADARHGRIVVATQVIEQSLDLDFDAMVTDVAPIDLIVQRAGRLWRHRHRDAERSPQLRRELVVLSPPPDENPPEDWLSGQFRPTAAVYEHAGILWRTVRTLDIHRCIATPDGLRDLIESVYGTDAPSVPDSLLPAAQRAEGKEGAHASAATYAALKPEGGYHGDAVAWLDDLRVPTRLGDETTTVRLARVRSDGALEPWVQIDGPLWKGWALSEVRVSTRKIPLGSTPTPENAAAAAQVRATWGRFEQDVPIVPLRPSPCGWTGVVVPPDDAPRTVSYSAAEGLAFGDPGAASGAD